jgi:hypothetical protein
MSGTLAPGKSPDTGNKPRPLSASVYPMGIPKVSPFPTRWGLFIFIHPRYSDSMNTLLNLPNDMTRQRGLTLILTADKARTSITELIARLTLSSPLFVIAASEWLPAYELTRILRRKTLHVRQALNNLRTARTSTCYRLLDTLVNIPPNGEPILVLDFLYTFYDPDVPLRIRLYKLRECCRHLKYLAFYRPMIVMAQELQIEDYEKFSPALLSIADQTLTLESEPEQVKQPELL